MIKMMIKWNENKKIYSILKGMFYVSIIYVLLWWIPVFGPMVAGYVAGRKSGSPIKGIISVLIPAVAVIAIIYLLSNYQIVYALHAQGLQSIAMYVYIPLNALGNYLSNFENFLHYIPPNILVLVIFAYIGGIMSLHVQNEGLNTDNRKIKEWQKHPKPVENNIVEEPVEKPKLHPLIKKAVKQRHNEFKKRKKEEEIGIDTL
jgi:hypothetical protein